MSCMCAHCKNSKNPDCGRYPEFLNEEECKEQDIEWEDWFYRDCSHCDDGCPTFFCCYYEPQ